MKKKTILIIAILSIISASIWIYMNYENAIKEQKTENTFGDNPVYIAMKDRFPDMTSSISSDEEKGTGMYAHVTNAINGNEVYLTLHKGDSIWGNHPTSITCRTVNGVDSQYTDDFVIEYIKNTDCLDIGADPDIVPFESAGNITKERMGSSLNFC